LKALKVKVWSTSIVRYGGYSVLCGTRIMYVHLFVYLVGGELVDGVKERGIYLVTASGDSRPVYLFTSLVVKASNRFKGSFGSGCSFLGARARRLSKNLNISFIIFRFAGTSCELMK
jgi:hypothetical protein